MAGDTVNCDKFEYETPVHTWVLIWKPFEMSVYQDPVIILDSEGKLKRLEGKSGNAPASKHPYVKVYRKSESPSWATVTKFLWDAYYNKDNEEWKKKNDPENDLSYIKPFSGTDAESSWAPFDGPFNMVGNIAVGGKGGGGGCECGTCPGECGNADGITQEYLEITQYQLNDV
jgi:hypothetical protein